MFELKLLRKLKNEPYSEFKAVDKITLSDVKVMYGIYEKYYANTSLAIFEHDLMQKTGVFVIREPKTAQIVGFSTITEKNFEVDGENCHAFFSGDTIIEQAYWGSRALQRAMYRYIVAMKFRYPTQSIYWMLISKGFKTYLLLANNYFTYYPHYQNKHQRLEKHIQAYCEKYFSEYIDEKTHLLDFGAQYQPLKAEIAPITDEMRVHNQKIAFFEGLNPTWASGTELPCIGEIQWRDLYRYVHRFLTKSGSKGREDRQVNPIMATEKNANEIEKTKVA